MCLLHVQFHSKYCRVELIVEDFNLEKCFEWYGKTNMKSTFVGLEVLRPTLNTQNDSIPAKLFI